MEKKIMEGNAKLDRGSRKNKRRKYSISKMGLELKTKNKYWLNLPYELRINNRPVHLRPKLTLHKKYHGKYILQHWKNMRRTEAAKKRQKYFTVSKEQTT